MKYLLVTLIAVIQITACKPTQEYDKNTDGSITWLDIDQAASLENTDEKYYFVDVYTEWCGWCKVMDKKTFTNTEVISYLDENFHSIKFDAEQKEQIDWNGKNYLYKSGGRRGINELAPFLLDNRLSYPSFAILDKDRNPISTIVGYKTPEQILPELQSIVSSIKSQ